MAIPLLVVFAEVPDPQRETENKLHRLDGILIIAACEVIGGAESWESIAEYGRTKDEFFRPFLPLPHGIPSADTFERVFAKVNPTAFIQAFGRWMSAACASSGLVPIALDGKSVRGVQKATATGCLHRGRPAARLMAAPRLSSCPASPPGYTQPHARCDPPPRCCPSRRSPGRRRPAPTRVRRVANTRRRADGYGTSLPDP